jgi:apolipoprotein N-acyltransferase
LRIALFACNTASVIIAFFAGAACALGFAPINAWPLTLLALALLSDRVSHATSFRRAFLLGLCFGTGHFMVGLNWIATAFTFQANMPAWYGWVAVALLSLYLALYVGLCCGVSWLLARRRPSAFAFVFAAFWMLNEWLRGTLLTGFAWDPIGVAWVGLPWVARGATLIGTYGMSGVAVLLASLLACGMRERWQSTLALSALLVTIALLMGRLSPAPQPAADPALRVQVVQPNIDQDKKYDADLAEAHERTYIGLSGAPGATPRLLLWPEGATLHYLELEPDAREALAQLLGPHDLLLTGGPSATVTADSDDYLYHNSVFGMDPSGTLRWRYDKAHLVPFGEYLPERAILTHLGLSRLVPGDADFIPGAGPATFALPGVGADAQPITVGVQICYEIIFSGHVVDEAHRPSFLFNPSNDAWFGAWGPAQHLAQAQMRAIEEGIAIVRATPNGISALIGPGGNVIQSVPLHKTGVINAAVPRPLPPTLFSRFGLHASVMFGSALLLIGLLLRRVQVGTISALNDRRADAPASSVETR